MKNLLLFYLFSLLTFCFYSCSEEQLTPQNDKELSTLKSASTMKSGGPALELALTTYEEGEGYSISLDGSGSITLTWPDGAVEIKTLPASFWREFDGGSGVVRLQGDLKNITSFDAFGYTTHITGISGLKHLKDLKTFLPGSPMLSEQLDLSHNRKLQMIDLFHVVLPESFKLPNQHYINAVTLTMGDRAISSEEVDYLIDNIYLNTVRRNIYGGYIHMSDSEKPSASSLDKIGILEEKYGWDIQLNQ